MAHLIDIPTMTDERGSLSVLEKDVPFDIKRVFYIYNVTEKRGGHGHKDTQMCLICVKGSCEVHIAHAEKGESSYSLNSPQKALYLEPTDWHEMTNFSEDAVLVVLASKGYDKDDYIFERPL